MNKKISLGFALALIFLSVAISVAATMKISMRTYNFLIKDLPDRSQMYAFLSELDGIVRSHYYGEINENLLNSDMADGYVQGLGDAHSYYMTPSEYDAYRREMQGEKMGIGIVTVFDRMDMRLRVSQVAEDSPAALSSMERGDVILSVADEEVNVYNYREIQKKLTGDGTLDSVAVTFLHKGEKISVSIVRGYAAQTVYSSSDGEVGYIKITDFYTTTADQLRKAVEALTGQGVSGIVIDLRGTSNGRIVYAAKALDVLVPVAAEGTGALATALDKNGDTLETFTSDADSLPFSAMILVNSSTSGPAELFACDMRDFGMAKLVGTATKGNDTMQKAFRLSDGSAVMLTVAQIRPYISGIYNGVGLVPDYEVTLAPEKQSRLALLPLSEDEQYKKASALLTGTDTQ